MKISIPFIYQIYFESLEPMIIILKTSQVGIDTDHFRLAKKTKAKRKELRNRTEMKQNKREKN